MKDRTIVILAVCGLIGAAAYSENTAAQFVAVVGSALFWQGHNIEVKLNKILDRLNIDMTWKDYDK